MSKKAKYISFELVGHNPKTKIWNVIAIDNNFNLGTIRWFASWRGYVFYPNQNTIFEKVCLRDIADFIEEQNNLHKQK